MQSKGWSPAWLHVRDSAPCPLQRQVASLQEEKNSLLSGKVRADRRAEALQAKLNESIRRAEGEAKEHSRASEQMEALQERMEVVRTEAPRGPA